MKITKFLPILSLFILHLVILINLQFTAWPEMFSFPFLLGQGFNLYGDMIHPYPPLLTLLLAGVYKIFGLNLLSLEIFTWFGILASDLVIFLIVKQNTKKSIFAYLALIFYIATQPFLDGNMLWFDTALTLPVLLAIYFRHKVLLSGIFLAAALLTKQTAIVFIGAFLMYMFFSKTNVKKILLFLLPIFVSVAIFLVYLVLSGGMMHFYNWSFYYPSTFWVKYPSYEILTLTKREIIAVLLVLLPSLGLIFSKVKKDMFLFLLLTAGIVATYPRFSFYHFQPALAISAILFGLALSLVKVNFKFVSVYFLFIFLIICIPRVHTWRLGFARFSGNEDLSLARTITDETNNKSSIYLLGPHSAIYVLSGRLPPKPWVDNYGWYFEIPGIQESVIDLWEKNPPQAIVVQDPNPGDWYEIGTYQPANVLEWLRLNYNKEKEIKSGVWLWRKK